MKETKISPELSTKIIWIFLFLNPFCDVATSFANHYLGRSLYLVLGLKFFFLVFLFFLCQKKDSKKLVLFVLLGMIFFSSFLVLQCVMKGFNYFLLEAQSLFRTFYFPYVLSFLLVLYRQNRFVVHRKYLVFLLFLYLFFLVVPSLLGWGFYSYAHSKLGNIGWFYSTNEIGGILAILGPFLFFFLKDKNWFFRVFGILFYLLGIWVLGTKVPMIAFLLMLFCFFGVFYHKLFLNKEWKKIIFSTCGTVICTVLLTLAILHSSFYNNIKVHLNFLGINQVQDLFTFHHIDHFVFSERLSFWNDTHEIYSSSPLVMKVMGIGVGILGEVNPNSMKMIEMDYLDIFYHYGIWGILLFLFPFLFFFHKEKFQMDEKISITLLFLLALFSGHILVAPSVCVLVALVFIPKKSEVL